MNKLLKKALCGIITAAMMSTAMVIPHASAEEDTDLLMDITFDEAGTGTGSFTATKGGTVTENGAVSYVTTYEGNNALSIDTDAAGNYLALPTGLLSGKSAATVSFMIKPSSGWAFMTTPLSGAQDYQNEKYLGILATNSAFTAERYNNSGSRLSSVSANGAYDNWSYLTVVYEGGGTKVYVDGQLIKSDTVTVDIASLFTSTASTWIGHGNWGGGEGFAGMVDDYKIYGKALTDAEVTALYNGVADYNQKALVYSKNCYEMDTVYLGSDNKEIFSAKAGDSVKAVTTVKNYTVTDDTFTATLFSADSEGNLTKIATSVAGEVKSTKTGNIEVTATVPSGATKLMVKVTATAKGETYPVSSLYCNLKSPVKAPADSGTTTDGAHDPSIVKFPGDDNYYVYSSHHLIFKSSDLINWQKFDFTNINAKDISPKTYSFISSNYSGTTMNGTYWAPDVIYRQSDDHPYWMYISVSCGLGGRNSAISLMKSTSPLFWADKSADIVDAGIVFATKENSNYKTNAIDANIYTDPSDSNKQYFVWGSFWGGIQTAPMTADGFVEGIDYTSDSTILSTCQKFGTTIYTQRYNAAGPEGGWMLNGDNYRYAFTSYGWLGSNYNTRIARSPLTTKFSENTGSQLVDAEGKTVGSSSSVGTASPLTGYKLIGSYRLGNGSYTISGNDKDGYSIPRGANDAHIYYGPGHNSAIKAADGNYYYVSHTRKDATEIAATLQVRKMLFTADGWPVVSPVTYAGEVEQALPKDMLLGTYDLASVGHTKMQGSSVKARNFDLPVVSSKVTLNADGTMAEGLGTWTFDGDHTVTLTFTKDGDTTKDEFYKNGDVMTMYALFGYDKDEEDAVVALTGTDENHISQFATKSLSPTFSTKDYASEKPKEKAIATSKGNPVLGFNESGDITYAGDPAALVDGDTVYLYAGHDTATNESYVMPEWLCYSSKDMKTWKYEGVTMRATDISWRNDNTSAWASQVIKHGNKYYMYYCTWDKTSSGKQSIGVAVSDSPTGPFTDPLSAPIVKGTLTEPQSSNWNDIDPTVWVETVDGVEHRYLAWGNSKYYVCELNEDMISVKDLNGDGEIKMNDDIKEPVISSTPGGLVYTEAPWLYRRQDESGNYYGKYYLFGAFGWREQMGYMVADSPYGPYEAGGVLMPPTATSNTNHPAVIDFKGHTYFIYHNGSLPHGSGFRRVVCIEEFTVNPDGTIDAIEETSTGLTGTKSVITQGGDYIYHEHFENPSDDASYPLTKSVGIGDGIKDLKDAQWEIRKGKSDETKDYLVSIEAVNKPGLYLQANNDKSIVLTQDATADSDGIVKKMMTFKTVTALDGSDGVSFESVYTPGYYITRAGDTVKLTNGTDKSAATFNIDDAENAAPPAKVAAIDNAWYEDNTAVHFRLNNAMVYSPVNVYTAEYDTAGKLINVAVKTGVTVTADKVNIDVPYAKKSADSTLKLYVWNSDMSPAADAVTVTATTAPYAIPAGYTSHFTFDDSLTDEKGVSTPVTVGFDSSLAAGSRITTAKSTTATYDTGYKGKAVKFTGAESDGVNLGSVITDSKYTLSFYMKAAAFTQHTAAVFAANNTDEWHSLPIGWQTDGKMMIWSHNSGGYVDNVSNYTANTNTWYNITIAADGGTATIYVDGNSVGSGSVANVIGTSTNTYLGVNFWDTPFNGLIDEMYIYNGKTLTASEVSDLYNATN